MFLSQRPNNDPHPAFTQTRDPKPLLDPEESGRYSVMPGMHPSIAVRNGLIWAPRHEEFDTPVNPILAAFRSRNYPIPYWVHRLKLGHAPAGVEATPQQIDHARRVLSKLVAVYS